MGNKQIPDEVVTAMELAVAAGWKISNRNRKITINPPGYPPLTIGHNPNELTMRDWRVACTRFGLVGQGPARTPEETERLIAEADQAGIAEAEKANKQRRAYEAEQQKRQQEIEAARQKAEAAIQQGLKPQEDPMPKSPRPTPKSIFPKFDPTLMGAREEYSRFLLKDGTYYCIECLSEGTEASFKAPQGLSAHRSRWHQLFAAADATALQETSRAMLPADVDTAMEMLRTAMAEALGTGADSEAMVAKEAELAELTSKLEQVAKQADADRKDFDKKFLESQDSARKALDTAVKTADAKREKEIEALMQKFMGILVQIRKAIENKTPVQATAEIDIIISGVLSK